MKEFKQEFTFSIADGFDEFNKETQEIISVANEVWKNAYAKYSKFYVGAAVLLQNGEIVKGTNQENAVYPLGLCAERVALFSASTNYPYVPIVSIALATGRVIDDHETPTFPCGSCRQAIHEYEDKFGSDIKIYVVGSNNKVFVINTVKDILPFSCGGEELCQI